MVSECLRMNGAGECSWLWVHFSALTLLVALQEWRLVCKKPVPLMPKGSCLEQVEEENQGGSPGNSCVSNVLVGLW